jgi:peptidyl-prolyl cis-trans isomerase-like 4
LFYNVQQNYIAQTGDPTATGNGGVSVYELLGGKEKNSFNDEIVKERKLNKIGYVCMAHGKSENSNRSQFFFTLRNSDMDHLEKFHTIFGEVAEGLDVLEAINNLYCDEEFRPYQDVRIKHTYILDDPFPDPNKLIIPPSSPERECPVEEKVRRRIPFEESLEPVDGRTEEDIEQEIKRKEAKSRAIVLEMTGDIPDAEVKPPDEVLFVCKLNSVTTDEDLELIFSRFGKIKSCEIIRDHKTGDSLNYAFIEFETESACIEAYDKMNNVLIDDRRIKVDFSQSVSKLWNRFLLAPRKNNNNESTSKTIKNEKLVLHTNNNNNNNSNRNDLNEKNKFTNKNLDSNEIKYDMYYNKNYDKKHENKDKKYDKYPNKSYDDRNYNATNDKKYDNNERNYDKYSNKNKNDNKNYDKYNNEKSYDKYSSKNSHYDDNNYDNQKKENVNKNGYNENKNLNFEKNKRQKY